MRDVKHWAARPRPVREVLEGRYVRLEPLAPDTHGDGLFAASSVADAEERFRWLADAPPQTRDDFQPWLEKAAASHDPLFFAVIETATGIVCGRQAIMRIDAANGVAEIGSIYWGPRIAKTRLASEAFYLFARYIFDDLGYRRVEWKCNDRNASSKRAALRFGFSFEGVFRQHMVVKGENRDTAWFSLLAHESPLVRQGIELWLAPENFDTAERQKENLGMFMERVRGGTA